VSREGRSHDDDKDRRAVPRPSDERLIELAHALTDSTSVVDTIDQVVAFAVESTSTHFGGVTLIQTGGRSFETVGATDPLVERADHLQYDLGEGPCIDAALDSKALHSPSLRHDDRWPRWGPAAADLGFNSIISAEIHGAGQRIGAINLYGMEQAGFTLDDIDVARLFAAQAGATLWRQRNEASLLQALDTRTMIGQAQGILMERYGLSADEAFSVLRRYSQHSNQRVRDIVARLVTTRDLPVSGRELLDQS
jgi:GAF domain-containing protein